jgi:hypothetical protein
MKKQKQFFESPIGVEVINFMACAVTVECVSILSDFHKRKHF